MAEEVTESNWIETLPKTSNNEIIFIRHGESFYSGEGQDLTPNGVEQIKKTANTLADHLDQFDSVLFISSTTPRAIGSAEVFVEEINKNNQVIRKSRAVRSVDIKDLNKFLEYDDKNSTPIYGQLWLTDPLLAVENEIAESRKSVEKRAERFIYHYSRLVDRLSKLHNKKIAVVVFTHFEVAINYLKGIYSEHEEFPITAESGLHNAEAVILQLDNPSLDEYTVYARGIQSRVVSSKKKKRIH